MKRLTLTARFGRTDENKCKVCLVKVKKAGQPYSDHEWVHWDKGRLRNLKYGDYIKFTAIVTEYKGIDENEKVVTKTGLSELRNIERL